MKSLPVCALAMLMLISGACASEKISQMVDGDVISSLATGGLTFVNPDGVTIASENLFISAEAVRIVYHLRNNSKVDQTSLVAFSLPDLTSPSGPEGMIAIPDADPLNLFGFAISFDGKPVATTPHQYALSAVGVDQTEILKKLAVPLMPPIHGSGFFGNADAANALPLPDKQNLVRLGMLSRNADDAAGTYAPIWTLRSIYDWQADLKAGQDAEIVLTYKPSVGFFGATTFFGDEYGTTADYRKRYCIDENLIKAVTKAWNPKDPTRAPFWETNLTYAWSTGETRNGLIDKFHLTVDKGDPKNLVAFCWDARAPGHSKITRTSPTIFEMDATSFFAPGDGDLQILILQPPSS